MIFIDIEELLQNSSGVARVVAFATGNGDGAAFGQASQVDRTYFSRAIPDEWQNGSVGIYMLLHHRTGGLAGTGSPPDDQVKLETGWAVIADAIAYPDLGTRNDGTAPNEADENLQLGVTIEAVLWHLLATATIGIADRFIHVRITRDASDTGDDGLAGNMVSVGAALVKL